MLSAGGGTMITPRQRAILNILVGDYISSVTPVSSHAIARRRELGVSPATVRNEMAELEESGYIRRPHVSAGAIPSARGYRHFVATIPAEPALPEEEASRVRWEVRQAVRDIELWTGSVAEVLASLVGNMAVVSAPRASRSRVKRVELVLLHETRALLVLVFQEAKAKQRILPLAGQVTQERLTAVANRVNARYTGATYDAVRIQEHEAAGLERELVEAVREMLMDDEAGRYEEPSVHGLHHLLGQPEFARGAKASVLVDVLEDRRFLRAALPRMLADEHSRVVIGDELEPQELHDCSVVVARYGTSDNVAGIVAVIGPTRMPYQRSIASVKLLAESMTELVAELT